MIVYVKLVLQLDKLKNLFHIISLKLIELSNCCTFDVWDPYKVMYASGCTKFLTIVDDFTSKIIYLALSAQI